GAVDDIGDADLRQVLLRDELDQGALQVRSCAPHASIARRCTAVVGHAHLLRIPDPWPGVAYHLARQKPTDAVYHTSLTKATNILYPTVVGKPLDVVNCSLSRRGVPWTSTSPPRRPSSPVPAAASASPPSGP